jgi:PPM family protein phosphatase
MPWTAKVNVGALSETGLVRIENQDRMSGDLFSIGYLYIIADGMGGYKGGSLAAELTVAHLREDIGKAALGSPAAESIRSAFQKANSAVYNRAKCPDAPYPQMGSTAVLLLLSQQGAWVAHVGDSRAYLFRGEMLERLTIDHTRVQRMVEAGILSQEEAQHHPDSHILERGIGVHSDVAVDVSNMMTIQSGDAFLLCSDGLSGHVTDAEIRSVLNSTASVQEIPEILVEKALTAGGRDNITVQYIECR